MSRSTGIFCDNSLVDVDPEDCYCHMMNEVVKVLIIDDDPEIRTLVLGVLQRNGIEARTADSAKTADDILEQFEADLIVLDLMMEGEDGLAYCRRLRQRMDVPVIMLTALSDDIDRIVGLEVGADDYLGKPFNPRELIARIRAVLRRSQTLPKTPSQTETEVIKFESYELSPNQMQLKHKSGEIVQLTSGEFAVLLALVQHAPRVLSRDQLLDLSRGAVANPFDRSIDSQVSRIRGKIEEDPKKPKVIKTVRNLGYVFAADVQKVGP